jgi:hypothetical protein
MTVNNSVCIWLESLSLSVITIFVWYLQWRLLKERQAQAQCTSSTLATQHASKLLILCRFGVWFFWRGRRGEAVCVVYVPCICAFNERLYGVQLLEKRVSLWIGDAKYIILNLPSKKAGKPYWTGRLSTVHHLI